MTPGQEKAEEMATPWMWIPLLLRKNSAKLSSRLRTTTTTATTLSTQRRSGLTGRPVCRRSSTGWARKEKTEARAGKEKEKEKEKGRTARARAVQTAGGAISPVTGRQSAGNLRSGKTTGTRKGRRMASRLLCREFAACFHWTPSRPHQCPSARSAKTRSTTITR